MFKNLGIGIKITLVVSLLIILSLGFSGILSFQSTSNAINELINSDMSSKAVDTAELISKSNDIFISKLEGIADMASIKSMDWEIQKNVIIEKKEKYGYKDIGIADRSGALKSISGDTANISDRDYFKTAILGKSTISDPLISKVDKSVAIVIASPIKDDNGNIIGVLIAVNDANALSNITNKVKIAKTGYAFMLNKEGTTIAHPNNDLVINQDNDFINIQTDSKLTELVEIEKKMINGESGIGTYSYNGKVKYMAYAPVNGTSWSVAVCAPQIEIFEKAEQLKRNTIYITIISIILSMLITLYISNFFITKPVKNLVEVANRLALGDVNHDIKSNSNDEIGKLSKSFCIMIDSIKEKANAAEMIAKGNTTVDIDIKSEHDLLGQRLQSMIDTIRNMTDEVEKLTNACGEGNLQYRGNDSKFEGSFRGLINGINKTLDAVIEPINEASFVLKEMAKQNLDTKVVGDYKGEHAEIKDTVNNLIETLNRLLWDINSASDQVAAGARQVSSSSQALSQGSSEQASSVEEITASITQIAAQTKQNALNANEANELAIFSRESAVQGNIQMKEMLKAMTEINDASSNISKIIKVIDEIAFQTNILALNAAVEAARAGQHGKGFAVVAEEVRNLAARSANAAKETTVMIEGSIRKVETGTSIANQTADALSKIVNGVSKAADLVGEIASASNEQATAISQINQAIDQVAKVTQMNTATAEESASASEELSSQAQLLKELIMKFSLQELDYKNTVLDNMNPDVLKAIKELIKNNNKVSSPDSKYINCKDSAVSLENVINLDDNEFGKY